MTKHLKLITAGSDDVDEDVLSSLATGSFSIRRIPSLLYVPSKGFGAQASHHENIIENAQIKSLLESYKVIVA